MKLEVGKLYKNRRGDIWKVVCVDSTREYYPVIAYEITGGSVENFTLTGRYYVGGDDNDDDLVAEHKEPREAVLLFSGKQLVGYKLAGARHSLGNYLGPEVEEVKLREVVE